MVTANSNPIETDLTTVRFSMSENCYLLADGEFGKRGLPLPGDKVNVRKEGVRIVEAVIDRGIIGHEVKLVVAA